MTNITGDVGPQKIARIAGLLYLLYIAIFAFSTFIQGKPVVSGNAAATAKNIVASEMTYPLYPVMFIAECGLALWLLIKGVKVQKEPASSPA